MNHTRTGGHIFFKLETGQSSTPLKEKGKEQKEEKEKERPQRPQTHSIISGIYVGNLEFFSM
jgi:hypothetical protein